jgi:DNA-binding NtrC family response regulator
MPPASHLDGKKVLIVDDEPDILETLTDLLDMCVTDSAQDFETAAKMLEKNTYDMTVLDVMGVNGYDLLERANQKEIPSVMLTAHALTKDNFEKSMKKGARAYLPKDKMYEIDTILEDVLEEKNQPAGTRGKWFDRVKDYFEVTFGKGWLSEKEGTGK